MEPNSNTIGNEFNHWLKKVENKNILLTFGYIRKNVINQFNLNIPEIIIKYFAIYAFLIIEYWFNDPK